MRLWAVTMAEPKWWAIIGLGLDLIGGVLVALTAWMRVKVAVAYGGPGEEPLSTLRKRKWTVGFGAVFLTVGFLLQMWSTRLQIPG